MGVSAAAVALAPVANDAEAASYKTVKTNVKIYVGDATVKVKHYRQLNPHTHKYENKVDYYVIIRGVRYDLVGKYGGISKYKDKTVKIKGQTYTQFTAKGSKVVTTPKKIFNVSSFSKK